MTSRADFWEFIDAEKTAYGVRRLCRVLAVSKSAYYEHLRRDGGVIAADLVDAHDAYQARTAWAEHRRVYGARRLTAELQHRGHQWNREKVVRLMRLSGIEGAHQRRRGKYGKRSTSTATVPDPVELEFSAAAPNKLWVADITCLRTWEGFLYLAVVIDACSCEVVGWVMVDHLRTELVLDAVGMAISARKPEPGLIHHNDGGSQYPAYDFGRTLRTSGILASMGRIGSAFDNAMADTFFATLKTELVYCHSWPMRHELDLEVFSYLEGFYSSRRRHSRLGNLSPTNYQRQLVTQNEASA